MTIENDPSSRIQVRSRGELRFPGSCFLCGSGTKDNGYLDFSTFFDYEGNMYLCMDCAMQAAETIGFINPADLLVKDRITQEKLDELASLQKEHDELLRDYSALKRVLASKFNSTESSDPPVRKKSQPVVTDVESPLNGSENREPKSEEPTPLGGSS